MFFLIYTNLSYYIIKEKRGKKKVRDTRQKKIEIRFQRNNFFIYKKIYSNINFTNSKNKMCISKASNKWLSNEK